MRKTRKRSLPAGIVFLLLCLAIESSAQAQPVPQPSKKVREQYRQAATNTVEAVWREVRPVLSAEQKAVLDKVKVHIDPDSWDIYGIVADTEKGTIEIPLRFVIVQDWVDSAVVAQQVAKIDSTIVMSYASAFSARLRENIIRREKHQRSLPVAEFPAFANISRSDWSRIVNDPGFLPRKDLVKLSSFAFILIHELAHHIEPELGFEVREDKADALAVDIGLRAGFNPMFAYTFFAVFAGIEEAQAAGTAKAGEGTSLCRGLFMFEKGRIAAEHDEGFMAYLREQGMLDAWVRAQAEIRSSLKAGGKACKNFQ